MKNKLEQKFDRIKVGKMFSSKLILYSNQEITELIKYFETQEEFEKCKLLSEIISKRNQHFKNYKTEVTTSVL